ncbi:ArsR family transcriptional regulator [Mariprofundus ferrinatatus]|uniref:ArsR family transcriptional regulator n=1 Tax=Mariprofundus ferrinatatus TaxID=1921087 RepID=A0A2K8L6X6_9PROT|nr:metalloregulator ArsR/SmtB family transcription factor [Mariprofundus ferrinatatus]ATX83068.1 ArsR family transcriptional regulator [Mariprofundus ferrinatatus]
MGLDSQESSEHLRSIFKALGDPIRLRLFSLLTHEELCVCHLTESLKLPQSTVSRHLGVLRSAGLVSTRREGKWMHYRLAEDVPKQLIEMAGPLADRPADGERGECSSLA